MSQGTTSELGNEKFVAASANYHLRAGQPADHGAVTI
jgi:hypothetical protein